MRFRRFSKKPRGERVRKRMPRHHRFAMWKAQKKRCFYCGEYLPFEKVTEDHKLAVSQGGSNQRKNKVLCCYRCNQTKGSMNAQAFKDNLRAPTTKTERE